MENEVMAAEMPGTTLAGAKDKAVKKVKGFFTAANAMAMSVAATMTSASAIGNEKVNFTPNNANADDLMGRVIGILLTITRFVGLALLIYGVYEIVMSFMQNQPEAKTKGIVMALAGVVMIGLKTLLGSGGLGLIS